MRKVREIIAKMILPSVLFALFFLLLFSSLKTANELADIYPNWSLRYDESIDENAIKDSRRFFCENEEFEIAVTFWTEKPMTLDYEGTSITADAVLYDGESAYASPVKLLYGKYLGEEESGAVMISSALSWKLFGGINSLGMTINIDDTEKEIIGIFEDDSEKVIIKNTDYRLSFENVELRDIKGNVTREDIGSISSSAGLGAPTSIIDGAGMTDLLKGISYLSIAIFVIIVFVMLLRLIKKSWVRMTVIFVALLAITLMLPVLLGAFPSFLIPSKWSDFSFWVSLMNTLKANVHSWFSVKPYERDILAKFVIAKSAVLSLLSIFDVILIAVWMKRNVYERVK